MSLGPSHPFIRFTFASASLDARTWLLLGECMSKCQHLAGVPLKPAAADELAGIYLARGVQATTAIEGNTLSREQVAQILREGSASVPESREYQQTEVQNIQAALREIDGALRSGLRLPLTPERLCAMNEQVLRNVPDDPEVVPGQLRRHNVAAGPYLAPHWQEVSRQVGEFATWLEELRTPAGSAREDRFVTAVLAAVLAHLYIAWIHPFGNGNGRVARLVEVQILSESGVVPLIATNLLSDHYNKTRDAYYRELNAAQRDVSAFVRYAVCGFADELREQITALRDESLQVHWESYVYEVFRSKPNTEARDRQRLVALTLPPHQEVTPDEVTELNVRLAKRYATCGERTPARDMNDLAKMGLVEKVSPRRYRVSRQIIEAFIPPVSPLDAGRQEGDHE